MFFRRISLRRSRPSVGGSETSNDNLHFDKPAQTNSGLSPLQTLLATVLLLSWLFLFAGGITMDTIQYRCAISAGGARALAMEARPGDDEAKTICKQYERWVPLQHSSFSNQNTQGCTDTPSARSPLLMETRRNQSDTHRQIVHSEIKFLRSQVR